jgi:hypothetical protein
VKRASDSGVLAHTVPSSAIATELTALSAKPSAVV